MAHIWFQDHTDKWFALPLRGKPVDLGKSPPKPINGSRQISSKVPRAVLLPTTPGSVSTGWALLWSPRAKISLNGLPHANGFSVLSDRDEIRFGGDKILYFSTEELAHVESFAGSERPIPCPRCKSPVKEGGLIVKCPNCGVVHHQDEKRGCWTYAKTCSLCPAPTDLEAGFQWTPENI